MEAYAKTKLAEEKKKGDEGLNKMIYVLLFLICVMGVALISKSWFYPSVVIATNTTSLERGGYSSMTFICSQADVTKINMSYYGSITAITFNSTTAYVNNSHWNGTAVINTTDKVLIMTWFCPRGDACIYHLSFSDCAVMNTTKPANLPASYVLYFWRTGCEYCTQEEPIIHQLLSEGYQIISIDIANETMKQYATQYEITGTPTFVASNSERLIGYQTYDQLKEWIGKIRLDRSLNESA